jgi:hypothetical protein
MDYSPAFIQSGRFNVEYAASGQGFGDLQAAVVAIQRRTVGADLFSVLTQIDKDVRMIIRYGCTGTHEFFHADFDKLVSAIVLEMGNVMTGHDYAPNALKCKNTPDMLDSGNFAEDENSCRDVLMRCFNQPRQRVALTLSLFFPKV